MTYAGNSPQKSARRAEAYSSLSRQDFLTKKHIVIASRDCGDIKFLQEHGIPNDNIIACDIDQVAVDKARKLGIRHAFNADIVDTVDATIKIFGHHKIATINVDLCSGIRVGIVSLTKIIRLLDWISCNNKIEVWLTFCRRDKLNDKQRIKIIKNNISNNWKVRYNYYQSWTATKKVGSPMCLLQLSTTRKGTRKMTTAAAKKAWKTRRANAVAAKKSKTTTNKKKNAKKTLKK